MKQISVRESNQLGMPFKSNCTTLLENVTIVRTSCIDTDFSSQMNKLVFLLHWFDAASDHLPFVCFDWDSNASTKFSSLFGW